jgi:hypothetical protein
LVCTVVGVGIFVPGHNEIPYFFRPHGYDALDATLHNMYARYTMKGQPLVEPVNIRQILSHSFDVRGCGVGVSADGGQGQDEGGVAQKRLNTLRHLLVVGTGTGVGAGAGAGAGGRRKS